MLSGEPFALGGAGYSVLFSWDAFWGGAHPNSGSISFNIARDGSPVTVSRLFPEPAGSLRLLWARIFKDTCAMGHGTAPNFYGSPPLREKGPAPA